MLWMQSFDHPLIHEQLRMVQQRMPIPLYTKTCSRLEPSCPLHGERAESCQQVKACAESSGRTRMSTAYNHLKRKLRVNNPLCMPCSGDFFFCMERCDQNRTLMSLSCNVPTQVVECSPQDISLFCINLGRRDFFVNPWYLIEWERSSACFGETSAALQCRKTCSTFSQPRLCFSIEIEDCLVFLPHLQNPQLLASTSLQPALGTIFCALW